METSDHEIQIFYRIDELPESAAMALLGQIEMCPGMPDDQKAALNGLYGSAPIWKKAASSGVGHDFHKHVRELIDGRKPELIQRLTLDDTARLFLSTPALYENDREVRRKRKLLLSLSEAAQRRLGQYAISSSPLLVQVDDLSLFVPDTGHSFAIASVRLSRPDHKPISAAEILEAQILLVRFGKVRWVSEDGHHVAGGSSFVLAELVQFMACGKAAQNTLERVTTSTFVQFSDPLDTQARDLYALHLARHYSSDYEVSSDISGVVFVADFDTVRHAVALEGAATVVGSVPERPNLPAFLHDFRTSAYRRHYVPIALLARHEHAFLVNRTSLALASAATMTQSTATIEKLAKLRREFIHFRLSYRFSELSFVTMHNTLNQAFRTVLHLDRMMVDLGSDVAAADILLREEYEQQKYRRFYWMSAAGAAALAALTGFTIVKETAHVLRPVDDIHDGVLALVGAGLAGIVSLIIAFFKRPAPFEREVEAGELTHEMQHHVINEQAKTEKE